MKLLFISNLYPPYELGGMEIRCKETVDMLRARGHGCHVLTSRFRVADGRSTEESVSRCLHLQANINYYRPLDFFLRRPRQERANRRAVQTAVDSFRPDVIFVWGMWNLSRQVPYWAEQRMPSRMAYALAGYWPVQPDVHESYWRTPALSPWAKVLMKPARWLALRALARDSQAHPLRMEHVACVSQYVRRKLTAAAALPHGARVIYNGIDPSPFLHAAAARTDHHDQLRLVYTGGLVNHKGVLTAVEALGLLQQQGQADGLSLTLVGAGHPDYEARLRQRVGDLGLAERVTFSGRVPRRHIPEILAEHDAFLFTSVYDEPIARSVMEAMAAGLAVIATPVGGQQEMLEHGSNALVYEPADTTGLAECILRLRREPRLRSRLALAGRDTVLQRFTLERMVDQMEAWLKEIAG